MNGKTNGRSPIKVSQPQTIEDQIENSLKREIDQSTRFNQDYNGLLQKIDKLQKQKT